MIEIGDYYFRLAEEFDKEQIRELLKENFGLMAENRGALSFIKGRYMVAIHTSSMEDECPKIVAVTGILPVEKSDYAGYEVTWTCTSKEHRHKGLITKMLKYCESQLPNDGIPLYCDCWRIAYNEKVNMYSVMQNMHMHEILQGRIKRVSPHSKDCADCIYAEEGCFCHGDLYMKERPIK